MTGVAAISHLTCSRCGTSKPRTKFPARCDRRSGRSPWCAQCHCQYEAGRREQRRQEGKRMSTTAMTNEMAIRLLAEGVARVTAAGFVVTGDLAFCRPRVPGVVETVANGFTGEASRVEFRAVPKAKPTPKPEPVQQAFGGDCCIKCGGHRLQQTGMCKTCLDCGEAGGCG